MSMIEIQDLTRDYGQNRGIFDLSFSVDEGEVFGFLGPNGAGKTTTIRHLLGFLKPESGRCRMLGQDCWTSRAEISRRVGYIPGEMAFFDDMTGLEFLNFLLSYRGVKGKNRMPELLERFELDPGAKLKKMSKGTKQKVGIAAAFMHDPDILILDEPTSGLDPLMQLRFIDLVLEEKNRGKTVLLSSHMFEEVERTCHRVSIIREGRLAATDSVEALKDSQVRRYIITLEDEEAATRFSAEGFNIETLRGNQVTVIVSSDLRQLIAVMNRYPVMNIATPTQSLEDIFIGYYGRSANGGGKDA